METKTGDFVYNESQKSYGMVTADKEISILSGDNKGFFCDLSQDWSLIEHGNVFNFPSQEKTLSTQDSKVVLECSSLTYDFPSQNQEILGGYALFLSKKLKEMPDLCEDEVKKFLSDYVNFKIGILFLRKEYAKASEEQKSDMRNLVKISLFLRDNRELWSRRFYEYGWRVNRSTLLISSKDYAKLEQDINDCYASYENFMKYNREFIDKIEEAVRRATHKQYLTLKIKLKNTNREKDVILCPFEPTKTGFLIDMTRNQIIDEAVQIKSEIDGKTELKARSIDSFRNRLNELKTKSQLFDFSTATIDLIIEQLNALDTKDNLVSGRKNIKGEI